jgi:hypothetical protein
MPSGRRDGPMHATASGRQNRLLPLPAVGDNAAMEAEPPKAEPKRRRRWLQFSLRTLLIVVMLLAVACWYVTGQTKIVKERQSWIDSHPRRTILLSKMRKSADADLSQRPSLIRVWLGDKASSAILAIGSQEAESAARLFPEAGVWELTPIDQSHQASK